MQMICKACPALPGITVRQPMDQEECIRELARLVSMQFGTIRALEAALLGALRTGSASTELRESVFAALEQEYSNVLAASTNPLEAEQFEATRARVMEALQSPPGD